jgi:protein CpxP
LLKALIVQRYKHANEIQLYKDLSPRNGRDTQATHTTTQADHIPVTGHAKGNTMKPVFKSLLAAGLIATAGFASYAQTADKPMPGATGMPTAGAAATEGHMGKMGHRDPTQRKAMMAKHLDALKAKLKITAAQEGAWTSFTSAMQPSANMDHQRPDRAEMEKLTTPQRIDKMHSLRTQHKAEMQAEMDKRDDAIKTFYAALAPEQQKVFDAEHARMGDRHGEKRGMHGHQGGGDKPM